MSKIEKHAPGAFCWPELVTTDSAGAKAFYSGMFGWAHEDMPIGEDKFYTMLKLNGLAVGALYELMEEQRSQGVPPHWMSYVSVESADASAEKAKQLGGAVLHGPMDVFTAGRMAVVRDPQGAVISLWQPREHIGVEVRDEPGSLCWTELATTDAAAATEFYTQLFGWGSKVGETGPIRYTEWTLGEKHIGGMMQMTAEHGDAPPHWMPYFLVADCDASAAKAKQLGGQVKVGPQDITDVRRFAVLQDPQGAIVAIYQGALD